MQGALYLLFGVNNKVKNTFFKWANPGLFLFIFIIFLIQFQ